MLDRLPSELVDIIFDDCDRPTRIRILQCSQKFRQAFRPRIYRHNVLSERCSAARWAVIHCRDDAVAFRVVEASVYAGMDVWAPQFAITLTEMFPRRFVLKLSRILGQSAACLSPFAVAVLKRREELVTSILSMTSATEWHLDKLLAPDIMTYLGKLTGDQPSSSSQLTPLHIASATGLDAVVKRILEKPAPGVVSKDARDRTPLSYAPPRTTRTSWNTVAEMAYFALPHVSLNSKYDVTCNISFAWLFWLPRRLFRGGLAPIETS
ncbi:hypothetical protein CTAM01_17272 [Colletotrichum tamarilloi]|uniref:F-box domain-containing protein n=1 Tax=Colletotrichum tamarilloi TaxID=1209934 RepID=A0ABQ9QG35_9PEZI|nr:uncharacterized protein CTAM01_17272 [Colletotrichum tamarilloi]KAK1452640.1 hypothetical protein CTAM01_17272 [Colletotrichum tamarilloi]